MNLEAAWQLTRGAGVRIGHPDTGYLRHDEIENAANQGPVRDDLGWDFEDDDSDPRAEMDDDNPLPGGPNHGTATASVIAGLSSPQVGFSRAIRRIRSRKPRGTAGLRPETSAARTLRIPALADAPSSHDTVTLYNMSDGRPISEFSM